MKNSFYILAFIFGIASLVISVQAQEDDPLADITYPIAELGNCTDKEDCLSYCDDPKNMEACLNFAEEHSLLPEEDIEIAKKMLAAGETEGPGGCRGVSECGEYCDDISHIRECVAFAEKHDLMPEEELEEAKKVADALDKGIQPPPCNSKSECDDICTQPENMKTCITFAKEAGLMPEEELEEAEKVLAALEKGVTPPPCGNKDDCDEYCSTPENFETCINFAEAAGFMTPEEVTMIRRTGGKGPGGCRGKEACEAYCDDPANMEPCINFAIENSFMSPEEAEQAKKMIAAGFTSGPGGCRGAEECEGYCDDVSHMTECVDFAEKTGMMSQEEVEQARQGMQMKGKMTECLALPCSEALECFQSLSPGESEGEGIMEAPEGEAGSENDEIQDKIESCIQEMMPQEGMMPSEGFGPPEGEMPIYDESQGGPAPFIPEGPSQEEINKMIEEETQRKIQQIMGEEQQRIMQKEIDRMMEQQSVPPTGEQPPQSFFKAVKNFLAGLVPAI